MAAVEKAYVATSLSAWAVTLGTTLTEDAPGQVHEEPLERRRVTEFES